MDKIEHLNNAKRLAYVLENYQEDTTVIKYLAHYLNYTEEQLQKDIKCLSEEISKVKIDNE